MRLPPTVAGQLYRLLVMFIYIHVLFFFNWWDTIPCLLKMNPANSMFLSPLFIYLIFQMFQLFLERAVLITHNSCQIFSFILMNLNDYQDF